MNVNGQDVTIELSASAEKAGKAIEKTTDLLKKFSNATKNAAKSTSKFAKAVDSVALKAISLPIRKASANVSDFAKKVSQLGAAFKRIVFYRAIRTIIKEIADAFRVGTQNLYYYSQGIGGEFARSMDMAATSMLYFKNSIGAAVAPIVNALAPVLDMLVDKIVAVINAINQLFAKLTGATSWTKAIKHPVAYGEAVKGAGKAAKEALRYLAPFDELNVLPSDRGGGGGGSNAAEDYSSMFEEMTAFDSAISDFAERIKAAIKAGDWRGAGKILADKMNEIVSAWDSHSLGAKIGKKINNAIEFAYGFLKNFDFRNLGFKIADGINGALENINFETAGRLFIRKFTALFDFIIGFVEGLDWGLVGKSIGDYLRGAFDEASEWLNSVDWDSVVQNLWKNLKKLIEGIDFKSLAKSFWNLLGNALGAAFDFIKGVIKELSPLETLLLSIASAVGIVVGAVTLYNQIALAATAATTAFKAVMLLLSSPVAAITAAIAGLIFVGVELYKNWDTISGKAKEIWSSIKETIVNTFENVKTKLAETWDGITKWFQQKWTDLKNWWSKLELPAFKIKKPHLSWTSTPATGWIANVLKTLGLPTSLPKLNVQWYAKGGIIDKASLIGAGEAGKEAIIPLERNTEWISRVAHEMREQASRQSASPFGGDIAGDLEDANGVVVNAIFAATAQIIQSMQENNKGGAANYNALVRDITRLQKRQAMATGV